MPIKKSLHDIKPATRAPRRTVRPTEHEEEVPVHVVRSLPREVAFEPTEPRGSSRYGLWYVAVACVIGFLFSLSFLFEHASVTVTPKSMAVAFDASDSFTAQKDSAESDVVVYTQMKLEGDQSIKLPSTQSSDQSVAATGSVILYNTYTTAPYKLVKNTRLSTSDGKIYRLDNAVTIPGYKQSGGQIVPGSVSASVTASVPGPDYNIANADLSVPGLAGTPQGTKIYARTKSAIDGGISGTVYTIPADAASAALGTLKEKLNASLLAKAKAQLPEGYVLFDGATLFTSDDSVQVPYSTEQNVPLALHGTFTAYLIKEDTLVRAIAEKNVSQYDGEPVTIPELSKLTLTPVGVLSPSTDSSFSFTLSGTTTVVWTVDPTKVQNLFAGQKKSSFNALLGSMPSIDRAEVVLKPFWKRTFPTDPNRLTVTISQP